MSFGTLRKSEATIVRLSMYMPAEETPIASTLGMCAAADFSAETMPSKW